MDMDMFQQDFFACVEKGKIRSDKKIHSYSTRVYLAFDTCKKIYKIGISKNVTSRMKTMKTGNPHVILFACSPKYSLDISRRLESSLHERYSECHIDGEWFCLGDIDINEIVNGYMKIDDLSEIINNWGALSYEQKVDLSSYNAGYIEAGIEYSQRKDILKSIVAKKKMSLLTI